MTTDIKESEINQSIFETKKILTNQEIVGALSSTYANMAQISGLNSLNASANQQQLNIIGTAIVAAGANRLLGLEQTENRGKLSLNELLDCLHKLVALTSPVPEKQNTKGSEITNESSTEAVTTEPEDTIDK
ncbi:MAG: RebB family R body protein [Proteobacteria bacterium]|nr:RebB family R body protein [Pseudomonadota bacterium]